MAVDIDEISGSDRVAVIAQAMGMISVQVHCSVDDALLLMQARAQSSGWDLEQVAIVVVERRIRFDDD
jgi:hypothetical protein